MIYFVTSNLIKTTGIIDPNVDETKIAPLIQFASKAFILPMLGTYFYNDLLSKYNAQTLSADETTLVSKMQPAIVWRACAQAGLTLSFPLTNKGYLKQIDDNAQAPSIQEVTYMYEHYIAQAKLFEKEISDYLFANTNLFANFMSNLNTDSNIKNNYSNYKGQNYNESNGFLFI
jgi:hypothetical protein